MLQLSKAYCRKHETLKGKSPAQVAGLTDRVWKLRERVEAVAA
jgi:hypothetical protein